MTAVAGGTPAVLTLAAAHEAETSSESSSPLPTGGKRRHLMDTTPSSAQ